MSEAPIVAMALEGGTDAGSMLLFDPAALPDDYDARDDPIGVIAPLSEAGEIHRLDTASDGGYGLGVLMGGRLPDEVAGFARSLETAGRINLPSGRLYFAGIEYAFRRNEARLRKYPHMGACLEVPAGVYRLALYEMDYPEGFLEELFRRRAPAAAYRLRSLMNRVLIPLGCLGAAFLAVSLIALGLRAWITGALPLGLATILLPLLIVARSSTYREISRCYSSLEREYPGYWAILERCSSGECPPS